MSGEGRQVFDELWCPMCRWWTAARASRVGVGWGGCMGVTPPRCYPLHAPNPCRDHPRDAGGDPHARAPHARPRAAIRGAGHHPGGWAPGVSGCKALTQHHAGIWWRVWRVGACNSGALCIELCRVVQALSTHTAPPPLTLQVGHTLENDLKALRLVHGRCIDTSFLFPTSAVSTWLQSSLND